MILVYNKRVRIPHSTFHIPHSHCPCSNHFFLCRFLFIGRDQRWNACWIIFSDFHFESLQYPIPDVRCPLSSIQGPLVTISISDGLENSQVNNWYGLMFMSFCVTRHCGIISPNKSISVGIPATAHTHTHRPNILLFGLVECRKHI